jgi:hypothetical protein
MSGSWWPPEDDGAPRPGSENTVYLDRYRRLRHAILAASGFGVEGLDEAGRSLRDAYSGFTLANPVSDPGDTFAAFDFMLRTVGVSWIAGGGRSAMSGRILADLFFVWAWAMNEDAAFYLSGAAAERGWPHDYTIGQGVNFAIAAVRSFEHAERLKQGAQFERLAGEVGRDVGRTHGQAH